VAHPVTVALTGRGCCAYHQQIEQVRAAEQLGFGDVWLTEQYFTGESVYNDALLFASAVAMRTQRIRIGFAVVQLPFHHPVRLAVQLALLDNLSKGRIDVGVGKGTIYNEYEFVGHGLRSDDSRERMEEAVDIIGRLWRGGPVTYSGKYFQVQVPELRPRPVQLPHLPLWRSVISPASFSECGRLGLPILTARLPLARIKERWAAYQAGLDAAGHDAATKARLLAQSALWRNVYVAESDAQAEDPLQSASLPPTIVSTVAKVSRSPRSGSQPTARLPAMTPAASRPAESKIVPFTVPAIQWPTPATRVSGAGILPRRWRGLDSNSRSHTDGSTFESIARQYRGKTPRQKTVAEPMVRRLCAGGRRIRTLGLPARERSVFAPCTRRTASLRRLVAHPTVQQNAQRGDEAERLVQHDVVSRLGHLDDGRSRTHQRRHVGSCFTRDERALFTKDERGATTHRLQILADGLAESTRAHGLPVELPDPAVLGALQRMATDEFDNERIVARLFGHQAEARQGSVESLINTPVAHGRPCERMPRLLLRGADR
jgi:alkanesulfonate monooxygenase SsuD/methylene tetrahydromethanopterin reductase-like flavin-dependent oxidoreductase (luciferase family)